MAKKDAIPVEKTTDQEGFIIKLWAQVARKEIAMTDAAKQLHDYVNGLPEDTQKEFRDKARVWGMWIRNVSEAFSQEMSVIAAGQ